MASSSFHGSKPATSSTAPVAPPVMEEFHTSNVQSYGERPRDSMRTLHVSYSYLTEEPHITLEFAAVDATSFGPRDSLHLKATPGAIPWTLSMDDRRKAKDHVNGRLTVFQIGNMMSELYKIKQKDAEKQCASALARAQEKEQDKDDADQRKSHAKSVQNGGIFG